MTATGGLTPGNPKRSYKKRPITDPAQVAALLDAARRVSEEHWEVVFILYRTGIEVQALRKITWREFVDGRLEWRRPKRRETLKIPVEDPELLQAVRGFIRRPRRSADRLDRLVKEARDAAGLPELEGLSPMTLRLTRAWLMLREGHAPETVARELALAPALVREVASVEP